MKHYRIAFLALVAALAAGPLAAPLSAAPIHEMHMGHLGALYERETLQEEFSQVYNLAAGGTVDLKNTNGSVTLTGWDQPRVQLTAIKKGHSKPDLDAVTLDIRSDQGRLTVRTVYPQGHRDGVSVSYTLSVPRHVNLELDTVNGSVKISGVSGAINTATKNGSISVLNSSGAATATTINGSITIELDQVTMNNDMKFTTTNGSIKVHLPANINADVQASTTNGGIRTDFPLTVEGKYNSKSMNGRLGGGGRVLTLKTVNGSVNLSKK